MAEVGSLNASLTLDTSEFRAGMDQAVQLAQALSAELSSALSGDPFGAMSREVMSAVEEVRNLQMAVESFKASLNSSTGADIFASIRQYTAGMSGDIEAATAALGGMSAAAQSTITSFQALSELINQFATVDTQTGEVFNDEGDVDGFTRALVTLREMSQELTGVESLIRQCISATDDWANSMGKVAAHASSIYNNVANAGTQTNHMASNANKGAKGFNQMANNSGKVAKTLQTSKGYAVSIKQIIEGIVVSQGFYRLLNIMESLVHGAMEFSKTMEEAEIKLKYLFSASEANKNVSVGAYINQMKELALNTGISATTLMEDAEQLQAMGFSAKASVPAMKILADTTMIFSGNISDANTQMTFLIKALGQMLSSGHVSAQELRQLYNAGLPIYEILSKALGISVEQARNIGKLNYDSAQAVYAILGELEKRYGGASEALTHTFAGAINVIKEGMTQLLNYLGKSFFGKISGWLQNVAQWVRALVKIGQAYGPGGVFQALFPEGSWEPLRQIISGLKMLAQAVKLVSQLLYKAFGSAFRGLLPVFATIIQYAGAVINTLAKLAVAAYQNVPIFAAVVKVIAGLIICRSAAKLVLFLAKALYTLTGLKAVVNSIASVISGIFGLIRTAPVAAIAIMTIVAALIALYRLCGSFRGFVNDTFNGITNTIKNFAASLGGAFDTSKIAQPEFKLPEMEDWSAGLEDLTANTEDLGDAADKASKKAQKFLQSFDEVYTINEDAGSGGDDGLGSLYDSIADMSDLNLDGITDWLGDWALDWDNIAGGIGGVSDALGGLANVWDELTKGLSLSEFASNLWQQIRDALLQNPELTGSMLGAAIGAILGRILGGKGGALIGAALGTLAGGIVGHFWNMLAEQFGLSPEVATEATIVSSIGGILGGLIGRVFRGRFGAVVGSILGTALGGLIDLAWNALQENFKFSDKAGFVELGGAFIQGIIDFFTKAIPVALKSGIKEGAKAGAKSGLKGGILGFLGDILVSLLSDWIVGSVGKAVGKSAAEMEKAGDWASWGGSILSIIGSIVGTIIAPGAGTTIGGLLGDLVGTLGGGFLGLFSKEIGEGLTKAWEWIKNFFGNTIPTFFKSIGSTISSAISGAWEGIKGFFTETIPQAWNNFLDGLRTFFTETIPNALHEAGYAIGNALGTIARTVVDFFTVTIPEAWNNFLSALNTFFTETIPQAWDNFVTSLKNFFTVTLPQAWDDFKKSLAEFFTSLADSIKTFFTETIPQAWNNFVSSLKTFFTVTLPQAWNDFKASLDQFFTEILNKVVTFFTETLPQKFTEFVAKVKQFGIDIINGLWEGLKNTVHVIWDWIKNFFDGFIQGFKDAFGIASPAKKMMPIGSDIIEGLKSGIKSVADAIGGWLSTNVFDPVKNFFKNGLSASNFLSTGSDIIQGIKNGITNAAQGLWNTITSIGSGILNKFENVLGINSPSKFTTEYGEFMDEGLINGIKNKARALMEGAKDLSQGLLSAMQPEGEVSADGIETSEAASLNSLKNWATAFVGVLNYVFMSLIAMFDMLDAKLLEATTALNSAPLAMATSIGPISAAEELASPGSTGTPMQRVSLTEESAELLSNKIADHMYEYLGPLFASLSSEDQQRTIAYIGTLVADNAGLKELERKLKVIRISEGRRG